MKIDGTIIICFFLQFICTDPVMKNASKYWPIVMKKIISKSAQEEKNETAEVKSHLMSGKCMALKVNLKENMNRRGQCSMIMLLWASYSGWTDTFINICNINA